MRILVVDDDELALELIKKILETEQHEVELATDVAAALEIMQTKDIQIVITDWNMPQTSGIELCHYLRSAPVGYIYIILITARNSREDMLQGLTAGADEFISKPFEPIELLLRIRNAGRLLTQQTKLRESDRRFRAMFQEHSAVMLLIEPKSGRILDANGSASQFYGYSVERLKSMFFNEINIADPDWVALELTRALQKEQKYFRFKHALASGEIRAVEAYSSPIDYGGETVLFSIIHDITEREHAEVELRHTQDALKYAYNELQQSFAREQALARVDELTGINNRRSLVELAQHEFETSMRYRLPLTVLMIDIDKFKYINDTFGHAIGDLALKHVTKIICANLRAADLVGRYGGDEFVILLPQTSPQEARLLAERIHASLTAQAIETDKGSLSIMISIGISQTIHHTIPGLGQPDTIENLFLRVDQAMYTAKQTGRNRTEIFDLDNRGDLS
jgi:diguanylate cyclase (GGDEF)-like protein/PAS domain S-box-containing protein